MENFPSPKWWQRLNRRIGSTRPSAWFAARTMHHIDRQVYDLTEGKHTAVSLLLGLPAIQLTTIGAKSGMPRTVPLIGIPREDNLILIASNWGQNKHPAWYHNLSVNPRVAVTFEGARREYFARELQGDERRDAWDHAVSTYGGYDAYKARTDGRVIPVILLEPIGESV